MAFTILGALRSLDASRNRAELYRAWNTGLAAGIPAKLVLEQMGPIPFPSVEEARRYLVVGLGQGKSVTALVNARPKLFAPFEGAVLAAGDQSGKLDHALRLLTDHFAADNRRLLKVRDALLYPVFFGLVASFGLPFVLMHASPMERYSKAIVLLLAAFLMLGGTLISALASIVLNTTSRTRSRFAGILALMLEAGLPAGSAVRLAVDASGNRGLIDHVGKRTERELSTTPLATLFAGCDEVPAELMGQMSVADATGDYAGTLVAYARGLEERQK
jgi:type II secretory pathway component PulF